MTSPVSAMLPSLPTHVRDSRRGHNEFKLPDTVGKLKIEEDERRSMTITRLNLEKEQQQIKCTQLVGTDACHLECL